jgi:predicted esterase
MVPPVRTRLRVQQITGLSGEAMKRATTVSVITLGLLLPLAYCSIVKTEEYSSFIAVEQRLFELIEQQKHQEALDLLEDVREKFPEHDYEIMSYFGVVYAHTGDYEKCLDIWEAGVEDGYFFEIDPQGEIFEPFKQYERFEAIAARNEALRVAALKGSRTRAKVLMPANEGGDSYPLLIALHGGGSSMEWAEQYWRSKRLRKRFIVAYIQSYLHDGMKSYDWRRFDPRARNDIQELYDGIIAQYPVDVSKVVIGGVSTGGVMAIDVSINGVIPTAGFIGVCPDKPTELDKLKVRMAREKGIKGVIIGGEDDDNLPYQKEMVKVFRYEHLPHEFIVVPGMGRAYPSNFSKKIDHAVDYILGAR